MTFSLMSKVDLAREERINTYNKLVAEFRIIYKLKRLDKIGLKGSNEVNNLLIKNDYESINYNYLLNYNFNKKIK